LRDGEAKAFMEKCRTVFMPVFVARLRQSFAYAISIGGSVISTKGIHCFGHAQLYSHCTKMERSFVPETLPLISLQILVSKFMPFSTVPFKWTSL